MDPELLVRLYNVGLGDCIHVTIPDGDDEKHILIDCGNKYGASADLEAAIAHLEDELPDGDGAGKKRLDLLVVTHPHEDHVKGFDTELFANIEIRRIWLSPSMNPDHPQAQGLRLVEAFAARGLELLRRSPLDRRHLDVIDSMLELSKKEAMKALLEDLPAANGIGLTYVHADSPADELDFQFTDDRIALHVLAPMEDIDFFYLGKTADDVNSLAAMGAALTGLDEDAVPGAPTELAYPPNVSRGDFDRLRGRLLSNALYFTLKSGQLVNNTSIVLLLEWRGRRLLFTGDAEVRTTRKGEFEEGKSNGSWNTMWAKKKDLMNAPIDFLKVGHHGSHNATPWTEATVKIGGVDVAHPVNEILDALLPEGGDPGERRAIVSTHRTNGYPTIPNAPLLETLGKRVANAEKYEERYDGDSDSDRNDNSVAPDVDQPWRTDMKGEAFLEVSYTPLD